jgi:hypothetical protein
LGELSFQFADFVLEIRGLFLKAFYFCLISRWGLDALKLSFLVF